MLFIEELLYIYIVVDLIQLGQFDVLRNITVHLSICFKIVDNINTDYEYTFSSSHKSEVQSLTVHCLNSGPQAARHQAMYDEIRSVPRHRRKSIHDSVYDQRWTSKIQVWNSIICSLIDVSFYQLLQIAAE